MIVLDTNIVSELMKAMPDEAVRRWLLELEDTELTTTAVTVAEIEFGLRRLPDGRRREDLTFRFDAFISALAVLHLDDVAARETGRLRALREALGLSAQPSDMMIAGIALAVGAGFATRNIKDFAGLPIDLFDPWRTR
jgi:predicted nucleic acid-binding protein